METQYWREISKMVETPAAVGQVQENGSNITTPPFFKINIDDSTHVRNLQKISKMEEKFDIGYDSDGEIVFFVSVEEVEGDQMFDKAEMQEKYKEEVGHEDQPHKPEQQNNQPNK